MPKLTQRSVDATRPGERGFVVYDSDLRGFGLRVMPSGFKSWIVEYRPAGSGRAGNKKRLSLGSATSVTAAQARQRAKDILASVRTGGDPLADRAKARASLTVSDLMEGFLAEHVGRRRKATTLGLYQYINRRYITPTLGRRKAVDVSEADILKFHGSFDGQPTLANRVVAVLSSAYGWGAKAGHVPRGTNPTNGIERNRENKREHFLSEAEMMRLGDALREAETTGIPRPNAAPYTTTPYATAAIRLLMLTGCRLREILHLRWADVDLDRGWLLLPDSKTGRKPVVLNAPAVAVLTGLDRVGALVCPGRAPKPGEPEKPMADLKRPWREISTRAGLAGTRIHDLRHSFASVGAGAGLGLPVIGKLLGHTQASTTQRYAHLADDPLRRATEAIGATIATALGDKPKPDTKIVDLEQAKQRARNRGG